MGLTSVYQGRVRGVPELKEGAASHRRSREQSPFSRGGGSRAHPTALATDLVKRQALHGFVEF
jgi:hypothetical protein